MPTQQSFPRPRVVAAAVAFTCFAAALMLLSPMKAHAAATFIRPFNNVQTIASTVPKNGDVNPYGVAVVPASSGRLTAGDVLVSNFNNHRNLQGTGTTIMDVSPTGRRDPVRVTRPEYTPRRVSGWGGLTTTLLALRSGWVIVGSLPTKNGSSASMQAGCLIVINSSGKPVETISGGPINGPWDMTALDEGSTAKLFVSNVLNGTVAASPSVVNGSTIVRIDLSITSAAAPSITSETTIGTGFAKRTDPASLVVGPTGLGLGSRGTLFVADSASNRIASIPDAPTSTGPVVGTTVSSGGALNYPLGLAMAPNGDILTANGGDGNLVETTPAGNQVAIKMLDDSPAPPGPNGNGTLFGLAPVPDGSGTLLRRRRDQHPQPAALITLNASGTARKRGGAAPHAGPMSSFTPPSLEWVATGR
jgi:hypothetical protein